MIEIAFLSIVAPRFIMVLVGIKEDPGSKQDIREEYDDRENQDAYDKQ